MPELLKTSQAAQRLYISSDTLRRYEEQGRITAKRTDGGHRLFLASDITKLGRELGVSSSSQLEEYVQALKDTPTGPVAYRISANTSMTWDEQGAQVFTHEMKAAPLTVPRHSFTAEEAQELANVGRTRDYEDDDDFFCCAPDALQGLMFTAQKEATFATEELGKIWAEKKFTQYEAILSKAKPRLGVVSLGNMDEMMTSMPGLVLSQERRYDDMWRIVKEITPA